MYKSLKIQFSQFIFESSNFTIQFTTATNYGCAERKGSGFKLDTIKLETLHSLSLSIAIHIQDSFLLR